MDGDDEIWGGAGNDIIRGGDVSGGTLMQDVLRGGEGDDIIYGAFDTNMSAGGGDGTTSYFVYGDEGNDTIWGKQNMNEYIWGGSGDDEIHGGTTNYIVHINGNDGDDILYPGISP